MKHMRAAQIHAYGPPDTLVIEQAPVPTPKPGEVLVQVKASSVNPIDCKIRAGSQRAFIRYKLPRALGLDLSGVVSAVGEGVTQFAVGDEVFAVNDHRKPGSYAEYTVVSAQALAKKPASCSHAEAASLPLVGLTAWQSLFDAGCLKAGQRVLIQAGAGGVGSVAIQLAAQAGAHVITTCSARNTEYVKGLGAHQVIDYTQAPLAEALRDQDPLDLILDSLGGTARPASLPLLRRGGKMVSIVSDIPALVAQHGAALGAVRAIGRLLWFKVAAKLRRNVSFSWVVMRPRGDQLSELARRVDQGHLRPTVDRVFSLDDIAAAHALCETHHARGKIAIEIAP